MARVVSSISSIADAEQRLRDILSERPSIAERLSKAIATRRNMIALAVASLLWVIGNHALAALAGIVLDPFPFRWMQRVLVGSSLALATIAARAHGDRQRHLERVLVAQRDLEEAVRWAATSRTLQILARCSSA